MNTFVSLAIGSPELKGYFTQGAKEGEVRDGLLGHLVNLDKTFKFFGLASWLNELERLLNDDFKQQSWISAMNANLLSEMAVLAEVDGIGLAWCCSNLCILRI